MLKMKMTSDGSRVAYCGEYAFYIDAMASYATVELSTFFRGVPRDFVIVRRRATATASFVKLKARRK